MSTRRIPGSSDASKTPSGPTGGSQVEDQFEVNRENCGPQGATVRSTVALRVKSSYAAKKSSYRIDGSTMSLAKEEKRHGPWCLLLKAVDAHQQG